MPVTSGGFFHDCHHSFFVPMSPLSRRRLFREVIPVTVTAILIVITAAVTHQAPFRIIPLFISLVINLLQTRVNRYAHLIGSLNSIQYGLIDWHYGLYGTAMTDFLVYFPFQLFTFILWSRRSYKQTTLLRSMTWKQRLLTLVSCSFIWFVTFIALQIAHSNYQVVDSTLTLMSLLISILMLFAFVEYTWLMIPLGVLGVYTNTIVMMDSLDRMPFLVFSIFSLYCQVLAFFQARRLYAEQQALKTPTNNH